MNNLQEVLIERLTNLKQEAKKEYSTTAKDRPAKPMFAGKGRSRKGAVKSSLANVVVRHSKAMKTASLTAQHISKASIQVSLKNAGIIDKKGKIINRVKTNIIDSK